ncbi:MAG: transglutaminase family protein, partial [Chitinophagaceae bacterium]
MKFRITAIVNYNVTSESTLVLNIHPSMRNQKLIYESFMVLGDLETVELPESGDGNRIYRSLVNGIGTLNYSYDGIVENNYKVINFQSQEEMPVSAFPRDILTYLYPSRYCQSDKLFRLANHQFGHIPNPFEQVLAITEWINKNVEYLSGST